MRNKNKKITPVEEESGDGWLISYADMMTLIACFFILMMAFAHYEPIGFNKKAKELAKSFNKGKYKSSDIKLDQLSEEVSKHPELKKKLKVTKVDGNIAITFSSSVLFQNGKTSLTKKAESDLDILVDLIKSKSKNYKVLIEGHSDPIEYKKNPRVSSPWELSAIRATKVLMKFEELGFSPKRLAAISKGDSEPIINFIDSKGEMKTEALEQNRRVIIKVIEPIDDKQKIKFGFGIYFDE